MGWNTSALFVRDRSIEDVLGFLPDVFEYKPTRKELTAEYAWSSSPGQCLYLADEGGWCQLWDPDQRIPTRVGDLVEMDGPGVLKDTQALAVVFSSVKSTYALWLYEDAHLVRFICFMDGEPVEVFGEPLPIEVQIEVPSWGPDEDFLRSVIRAVTGLNDNIDQPFTVYDVV
ncbi:hypothetical protein [Nonomuraea sp. GTA35]|uniref:hypothetical protein n=1 Tax=Nonomuraea sp. GTA35 TaxID=1676746 RepID=UPI0035C0CB38